MTSFPDFERADGLLQQALELPPEDRRAFLTEACGDDAALRELVARLLAAAEDDGVLPAGGALNGELFEERAEGEPEISLDEPVGAYRLVREIGRGGMAVVYLAERSDGAFEQQVAVKLLRGQRATAKVEQRFLQERQILAGLRHPGIAQLLDGGTTPQGRPYLVMEHVEGTAIDRYCDERELPIAERLRCFTEVCAAVDFAHRQLIVHRDLKPSNILVSDAGAVKLLDFGIAKLLEASADRDVTQTALRERVLTPQYASPEQILGGGISTATDVYALGLLLYELLTGRRGRRLSSPSAEELERTVRQTTPQPPSEVIPRVVDRREAPEETSVAAIAARRGLTVQRLQRRLRGDLDNIVMMALRFEPERRYASVSQLAEDVERHLANLPVRARPDSLAYRARKLVARRGGWLAAAGLLLLSVGAGLVGTASQARRAELEARRAREVSGFLTTLFENADPDRSQGRAVTVRQVLDLATRSLEVELAAEPRLQATMQALLGNIYRKLGEPAAAEPLIAAALARRRELYGEAHPEVAETLRSLALVLLDLGRFEEAERLAEENLALHRPLLGETHPEVIDGLIAAAQIRFASGQTEAGRQGIGEALALLERSQSRPGQRAAALHTSALLAFEAGDHDLAELHLRQELALLRSQPQSRALAQNLFDLGGLLMLRGKPANLRAAEDAVAESVAIEGTLLGEGHPRTAQVRSQLASIRARRGDSEGAERTYLAALAAMEEGLGADHPTVATLCNNLAVFYHREGRWPEAIARYAQAIEIRQRALGPGHPLVGTTRAYLGLAQHRAGDPRAEATYRQALTELIESRGAGHEKVGNLQTDLGTLLAEQGRYEEAEGQLRPGYEIAREIFGDDDLRSDAGRAGLGLVLCGTGRAEEGQRLIDASRAWRDRAFGANPLRSATVQLYEVECMRARGEHRAAEERLDELLAGPLAPLAAGHPLRHLAARLKDDRAGTGG